MQADLCAAWLRSSFQVLHRSVTDHDGSELVVVDRQRFRNDRDLIPTRIVQAIEWDQSARRWCNSKCVRSGRT
jgi:hypothetical protein